MAFSRSSATRWVRSATAGPVDGDPGQPADLDALVVLDLGDGRADDVHELDGLAPLPGGRGAGEDHQALGVPAHTGRQVVQAEQVGEFLGVLGPAFHGVEEGELAVQQDLVAAGEVDEDLGDAAAQFGLLDGGLDGRALEGVEGLADLADLVLVVLQARRLGLHVDLFAGGEPAHHAGQPDAGGLVGLLAQPATGRGRGRGRCGRRGTSETSRAKKPRTPATAALTMTSVATGSDAVLVAVAGLGAQVARGRRGRGCGRLSQLGGGDARGVPDRGRRR